MPARRTPAPSATPLRAPLALAAEQSPDGRKPPALSDDRKAKKNYAQALSTALAMMIADCLGPRFRRARITPRPDGTGHEFSIGAKLDSKKTDVGIWDDAAGLILGVSIKTYTFRDYSGPSKGKPARLGRYQKNIKRNDMELRDEADVLHRRQPYAVLYALVFMPRDASWDGVNGHSSFAHAVFTFRKRAGRHGPDAERKDLFEKVYIGLFGDDGTVEFFDVENKPPRNQPPRNTITLQELIEAMQLAVQLRNEGVAPEERYEEEDTDWTPPPGSVPEDVALEAPLEFSETLGTDSDDDEEEDDEEE